MDEKLNNLSRRFLTGFAKLGLLTVAASIVVSAGALGFWYGFAACFDKAGCSSMAEMAFIIFPAGTLLIIYWLFKQWRKYKQAQYHNQVKQSVLQELNTPNLSEFEIQRSAVIKLLRDHEALTLDEISLKSALSVEQLLPIIHQLLKENLIVQTTRDGITTISWAS